MFAQEVNLYPELFLFDEKDKTLIVVGIQVAHLDRSFLLFANPLSFTVQQFDLHIGIYKDKRAEISLHNMLYLQDNKGFSTKQT